MFNSKEEEREHKSRSYFLKGNFSKILIKIYGHLLRCLSQHS
uniref:Uncharacterized protein n=1 Tax=Anguilla anguilla TaxID=7936 RepID=A0A0E9VLS8_ANGAN